MQSAEVVLSILKEKSSSDKNFVFRRVYRHLYNRSFYQSNTNKTDNLQNTIDNTISLLMHERYNPDKSAANNEDILCIMGKIIDSIFHIERDSLHNTNICLSVRDKLAKSNHFVKANIQDMNYKMLTSIFIGMINQKIQDNRFCQLLEKFILSEVNAGFVFKRFYFLFDFDMNHKFTSYFRYKSDFVIGAEDKNEMEICLDLLKSHKDYNICGNIEIGDLRKASLSFAKYDIYRRKDGLLMINIPQKILTQSLKSFTRDGKANVFPSRIKLSIDKIIIEYNNDLREFTNYYKNSNNFGIKFKKLRHYHYQSLLKTIACKEKTTVTKTLKNYAQNSKANSYKRIVIGTKDTYYTGFDN